MHNTKPARVNKEAKTGQIIRIEQEQLNKHLDKVVRGTVERTLNELLDAEADRLFKLADMNAPRLAKIPAPDITRANWRPKPVRSNSKFPSSEH